MGSRFSTRAQVALALAVSLLFGAALNSVITATLLGRILDVSARRDLAAAADSLARCIAASCDGLESGCVAARAQALSSPQLAVFPAAEFKGAPAPGVAFAAMPGGGAVVVYSRAGSAERTQAGTLVAAYTLLSALITFLIGASLLNRVIARPLDRLAAAAERIGRLELDDPLGGQAPTLGRLGVAFERMAHSLKEERARVSTQIDELEKLNRQLAEARDSLLRSEKLATVGRLAAGVAHEIGNPLGAILGYLELARAKAGADGGELLTRIDHEVARIDRTVRELLDFSRPAPQAPALSLVSLFEAVDAAVRLASVQKRLKHVGFSVQVDRELKVLAEPHRLSQVLVNVLLNAGDAMKGEGKVEICARRLEGIPARRASDPPPGPRIELEIADSGPGIASADLLRIFDPFFTTKEPGEGTGLGQPPPGRRRLHARVPGGRPGVRPRPGLREERPCASTTSSSSTTTRACATCSPSS